MIGREKRAGILRDLTKFAPILLLSGACLCWPMAANAMEFSSLVQAGNSVLESARGAAAAAGGAIGGGAANLRSGAQSVRRDFSQGWAAAKNETLPDFWRLAKNGGVIAGGVVAEALKFPAVLGEVCGDGVIAGAAKITALGNFSAGNFASGLEKTGIAAIDGVDVAAKNIASLGNFSADNLALGLKKTGTAANDGVIAGAAKITDLGNFSAASFALGLKKTGTAANTGVNVAAGNIAGLGSMAQNSGTACLADIWQKITCFFGFCKVEEAAPENEVVQSVVPAAAEVSFLPIDNPVSQKDPTPSEAAPEPSQDSPREVVPPAQIIQNIYPQKEIQTIHTREIQTQSGNAAVDQETKSRVDWILRQMDSDRPNYSLGQAFVMPRNLFGDSLNIGAGKFAVDQDGNVLVQGNFTVNGAQTFSGAATLAAATDGPLFAIDQTGAGLALRADNITLKGSTISTNDADTNLLINPNGTGAVQFHTAANYIDSTGNLVLDGDITLTGGGTFYTTDNGNLVFAPNGTGNLVVGDTDNAASIVPFADSAAGYDLGAAAARWYDIYAAGKLDVASTTLESGQLSFVDTGRITTGASKDLILQAGAGGKTQITDGTTTVDIADGTQALYAVKGATATKLADGTYAVDATGDIRLSGDITVSGGQLNFGAGAESIDNKTANLLKLTTGGDARVVLGDDAGTYQFQIADLGGNVVASIDSDGKAVLAGISTSGDISPATDLGASLGDATHRYNDIYVANISTSGMSTSGQAVFTYQPLSTDFAQSSVLVNPSSAIAGAPLLGIGVAGVQKFFIDRDGAGYFAGNVGIGTTTPGAKLDIVAGNLDLDNTTNANQFGAITKNGTLFIHDFNYGNNGTVTTDGYNTFIGSDAGNFTMGSTASETWHASFNTGVGANALFSNTTGYANAAFGSNALLSNTTGFNNFAMGNNAGRYYGSGTDANQASSNSLFVGYDTRANAAGGTNEIVIGASAIGAGSNSVVLGNDSIIKTLLKGSVGIGTTDPAEALDVNGRVRLAQTTAPGTTADRLYNMSGNLLWNGIDLTSGGALPVGTEGQMLYNNAGAWTAFNGLYWDDATSRLGIGTTTPSQALDVAGTIRTTGSVYTNSGNGVLTNLKVGNLAANGYFSLVSNNTEQVRIDSSGNVGIGTTSPAYTLDVNGGFRAGNATSTNALVFDPNTGNVGVGTATSDTRLTIKGLASNVPSLLVTRFDTNDITYKVGIGEHWDITNGEAIQFYAGAGVAGNLSASDVKMSIFSNGNVGIGTTSPAAKLEVGGATDGTEMLRLASSTGADRYVSFTNSGTITLRRPDTSVYGLNLTTSNAGSWGAGGGYIALSPNGSEVLRATTSGNVGIGTTSPNAVLEVSKANSGAEQLAGIFTNSGVADATAVSLKLQSSTDTSANYGAVKIKSSRNTAGAADLLIQASNTSGVLQDRFIIDKSGNVGIGTTAPDVKLRIETLSDGGNVNLLTLSNPFENSNTEVTMRFAPTSDPTIRYSAISGINTGSNNVGLKFVTGAGSTITEKMRITSTGNVGIGTTSPAYTLDVNGGFRAGNATSTNALVFDPNTGNVGVGTATPIYKLNVAGANASTDVGDASLLGIVNTDTTANNTIGLAFGQANLSGAVQTVAGIDLVGVSHADGAQSGALAFSTRNAGSWSEKLRISESGNVGIGTTSPGYRLHVPWLAGDAVATAYFGSNDSNNNQTAVYGRSYSNSGIAGSSTSGYGVYGVSTSSYGLYAGSTNGSAGNFTINPSSTDSIAEVFRARRQTSGTAANGIGGSMDFYVEDDAGNDELSGRIANLLTNAISGSEASALSFWTRTGGNAITERLRIDGSGYVGIGTASPAVKLQISVNGTAVPSFDVGTGLVVNGTNSHGAYASASIISGNTGIASLFLGDENAEFRGGIRYDNNIEKLSLWSSGSQGMIIDSAGNVGIGTTSPGAKLDISAGNLDFDNTTNINQFGVITKGGTRFIHNFNYGDNGTTTTAGQNTFVGLGAGNLTMGSTATEVYHGSYNTGVGYRSLQTNSSGHSNSALGVNALLYNSTGYYNSALGYGALYSNSTGNSNSALGYGALYSNSTGNSNSALGYGALYSNSTGNSNSALGTDAGRYYGSGTNANQTSNNSLFLGYNTRANGIGGTNEIVIGASAIGAGSNSAVLGNDAITKTLLKGNVGINNILPVRKLDITETTSATPQLRLTSDSSNYSEFYVDATGDLSLKLTGSGGDDLIVLDENLKICAGGDFGSVSCPTAGFTVSGTGNLIVENKVIADKFEQICPTGYVWVPGSAKHGTLPGFCVMKYEAKDAGGGVAESKAADAPWVSVSQENARAYCQALGEGYHLVSEAEWMTIAENIAATPINDIDAGAGMQLATGHSDNYPENSLAAGTDPAVSGCNLRLPLSDAANAFADNCQLRDSGAVYGYSGTGNQWSDTGYVSGGNNKSQLRVHALSNGNTVWDIAGNVWEWTDAIISQVDQPGISNDGGAGAGNWGEWNVSYYLTGAAANSRPPDDGWTGTTNGIGRLYTYGRDETATTTYRAFLRGGNWAYTSYAGVFALSLFDSPANSYSNIGFRCAR